MPSIWDSAGTGNLAVAPRIQASSPRKLPLSGAGCFQGDAPGPDPPYHIVQHASSTASFTSGTANSATVTFGRNITPGNTVVLFIGVNMGTGDISASSVTTNGSADNWSFPAYMGFYNNVGISGYATDFNSAGGSAVVDYSITQSGAATTSETTSVLLDAFEVAGLGPNPSVDAPPPASMAARQQPPGHQGVTPGIRPGRTTGSSSGPPAWTSTPRTRRAR